MIAAPLNPASKAAELRGLFADVEPRAIVATGGNGVAADGAAGLSVPIWAASMAPSGAVRLAGVPTTSRGARGAGRRRCRPLPPHQRDGGPAEGRAPHPHQRPLRGAARRFSLRAHTRRSQPGRDAALPRPRPHRRGAGDARVRGCGDRSAPLLGLPLLGIVPPSARELVHRRAHHPPDPARAHRRRRRAAQRRTLHPFLLGGARPLRPGRSGAPLRAPVVEAYGLTEAGHQVASNPLPPRAARPGTVGFGAGARLRSSTPTVAICRLTVRGKSSSVDRA